MGNGWQTQKDIWQGFQTKDVFQQKVCDAFQSLPCEYHRSMINKINKQHMVYLVIATSGLVITLIAAYNAVKSLISG